MPGLKRHQTYPVTVVKLAER